VSVKELLGCSEAVVGSGGLVAVLQGMKAHPDHCGVLVHGLKLIASISNQGGDEVCVH